MDKSGIRLRAAERMAIAKAVSDKLSGPSLFERLVAAPGGLEWLRQLSPLDATRLLYSWEFHGRPKQFLPDTPWETCLLVAGRGFGKNRTAAEFFRDRIFSGRMQSVLFVGPTEKETMRYMVGGRRREKGSGFLDVLAPWEFGRARLLDAKKEIRIDGPNGEATVYLCSGEDRELRGAGLDGVWFDEPIKVTRVNELLDNIMLALREGVNPQLLITTTPKANADWLRELLCDPGTIVRRGGSQENTSLTRKWIDKMMRRFGGTYLEAQELEGELLSDAPGTLFKLATIEQHRTAYAPTLDFVAICLDPSKSGHSDADDCGIAAVGRSPNRHYWVLADGTQRKDPIVWVATVYELYKRFRANAVVVETNNLGRHAASSVLAYWPPNETKPNIVEVQAKGDKLSRAEPLSVFYEKGRIHHVGHLRELEDELTGFAPGGKSPNRIDALGHGVHYLSQGYKL